MTAVVHRSLKSKPVPRAVEPAGLAHFGLAVEVATGVTPVSRAELEAEVKTGDDVETFTEVVRRATTMQSKRNFTCCVVFMINKT